MRFSLFLSVFLGLFVFFFAIPFTNNASAMKLGCKITAVGAPKSPLPSGLPPECSYTTSNNQLINAAQAIKDAYTTCSGGYTYEGNNACIEGEIKNHGFSQEAINAFHNRRPGTITVINKCTECLGFIGLALALTTLSSSALAGPDFFSASNVYGLSSFSAGSTTYTKVSGPPQPGDIGVTNIYESGHILIVKSVNSSGILLTALESNFVTCMATDNQTHVASTYVYFRKQ